MISFDKLGQEDGAVAREDARSRNSFAFFINMAALSHICKLYERRMMREVVNTGERGNTGEGTGSGAKKTGEERTDAEHWWWDCLEHRDG